MMNLSEMQEVIGKVTIKDHPSVSAKVVMEGLKDITYYLQLRDLDMDPTFNTGRKWKLSPHMTKSELVGTMFKAWMSWVEHEAREAFLYRDQAIFGPHFDVDVLAETAANKSNYEYRS